MINKSAVMEVLAQTRTNDVLAHFDPRSNAEYYEAQGRYCAALEKVSRRCGLAFTRELEDAKEAMVDVLYNECYSQGFADGLALSRANLLALAVAEEQAPEERMDV